MPANNASIVSLVISICGLPSGLTARIFNNASSKHIAVALYLIMGSMTLILSPLSSIYTVPVVDIPPMKSSESQNGIPIMKFE